jgi:hypothetical protein
LKWEFTFEGLNYDVLNPRKIQNVFLKWELAGITLDREDQGASFKMPFAYESYFFGALFVDLQK